MSLEIEFATSAQALPHHTSYQTPRRQQSHHETSSPFPSSSPPPDALGEDLYSRDKDISNDGNMSAMDPRRFTPNLHASLVAEILSLRREIESKNSVVGALEESLQETRIENGQLSEDLRSQAAEVRSVKRQMQLLEAGSHSAVGDIEKERDGVVDKLGDTQKRLETFKNKARSHEQELERSQELWTRDREVWDDEKRNLERKIHVVEGRLKTVLMEVAAAQDTAAQKSTEINHGMRETWFTRSNDSIGSYQSNGVTGRSRSSGLSNHGQDGSDAPNGFSTSSGLNGFGPLKLSGLSLAEELEFHDDDDDEDNLEEFDTDGGHASPDALPEEAQMRRRRASIQELSQDRKARKILGLLAESNGRLIQAKHIEIQENHIEIIDEKTNYFVPERALQNRDVGTQFSPPPSPKLQLQVADAPVERNAEQTENAANQRRKRVSVQSTSVEETTSAKSALSLGLQMVSAGCQTLDSLSSASITPPVLPNDLPEMTSSTTQTNDEDIFMMISAATRDDRFMTVPTIEIHPPGSRPPSSHNGVVLPPRTKSAACQVSIELPVSVRSISVQTDEIRPDKRSLKIPPRLVSVQGASKSTSWRLEEVKESTRIHPAPRKSSRRNPYRVSGEPAHARLIAAMAEPVDAYPGNNDNGPLNKKEPSSLRRPIRDQSLFAGFESASDGEAPQLPEIAFSDDDFANAPPIRKTLSKVENSWKLVPHSNSKGLDLGFLLQSDKEEDTNKENGTVNMSSRHESAFSKKQPPSKPAPVKSSTRPPNSYHAAREPNIRRTALISSGAAAHATRARSPSAPSPSNIDLASIAPPFPVPTRSSSRRIPISASDGTRSPTPYSTAFFSASRHQGAGRPPHQNAILRKVRSATAVPKFGRNYRRQSRSRSPPPPSTPSIAPESPRLPRLPHHDIPSQRVRNNHKALDSSLSSFTAPVLEEPVECHNQPPSVVDAIAQTMVGEWMWKYVRRRKSFGISESPHVEFDATKSNGEIGGGHGIRHKRWVWLAPYERAIMWSSKQPTSGSALLGKSGRKLGIQSVIDVKDDTPMPKNSEPQLPFNRSILILTPQRALKFTATSIERHHLWLRALSFLSQSANDLASIPPSIPRQEYPPPSRGSNISRRTPFFDSVRSTNSTRRPLLEGHRAHTAPFGISQALGPQEGGPKPVDEDNSLDAAEAPHVPRVSSHTRKRSNTGPRSGPPSISHTSTNKATMSSSNISLKASITRDGYSAFQRGIGTADPGPSPQVYRTNFFDAVGTVRMEAFIDEGDKYAPARRKEPASPHHRVWQQHQQQLRKKDLSYWGVGGPISHEAASMHHGSETRWKGDDPFKGF